MPFICDSHGRPPRRGRWTGLLVGVLLALAAGRAASQTIEDARDQLRKAIGREAFANLIAGFTLVNMTPDIHAANFRIDGEGGQGDATLSTSSTSCGNGSNVKVCCTRPG